MDDYPLIPYYPPHHLNDYILCVVDVEIYDDATEAHVASARYDLAKPNERKNFAEQMLNAYSAGQYSIVSPLYVKRKRAKYPSYRAPESSP